MADYADVASTLTEQALDHALANIKHFDQVSHYECEDCGEEIPAQRRQLGGVTRCVDCQTELESKQKHFRGEL